MLDTEFTLNHKNEIMCLIHIYIPVPMEILKRIGQISSADVTLTADNSDYNWPFVLKISYKSHDFWEMAAQMAIKIGMHIDLE